MINPGPILTSPNPLDLPLHLGSQKKSREHLHKEQENIGQKWISLTKPSLKNNHISEGSITFNNVAHSTNTLHNQSDPERKKSHVNHHFLYEFPFNSVISFTHIEFNNKPFIRLVFRTLEVMQKLMSDKEVIINHTPRHKRTLVLTDTSQKNSF